MADENSYGWLGGVAAVLTAISVVTNRLRKRKPDTEEVKALRHEVAELRKELKEQKELVDEMDLTVDKLGKEQKAIRKKLNDSDVAIDELRGLFERVEELFQSVKTTISRIRAQEADEI